MTPFRASCPPSYTSHLHGVKSVGQKRQEGWRITRGRDLTGLILRGTWHNVAAPRDVGARVYLDLPRGSEAV